MLLSCKHSFHILIYLLASSLIAGCGPINKAPIERWQHSVDASYAGKIADNGKISAISSIHHGISLWSLEDNALLFSWHQKQDDADNLVLAIDISNNNSHVVTASKETFALWNATSGKSEGYWKIRESSIRDIALSNNGDYVLIGKGNGTVVHVAIDTGRRLEFLGHQEKINSVDLLANGRIAISGGNDFIAYVWDTVSGQVIYRFNHPSRISKVALDQQGRYAFTADSKKSANIWDLKTGKLVSRLNYKNRQEVFSSISFSADGKTLLTGAPTRKVSLWDIATGNRLESWRVSPRNDIRPAGAVVYSAAFRDNGEILTLSSSGYAELWQTKK